MGGYASRKVLMLIDNLVSMMSIELIIACQAVDIVQLKPSCWLEEVHKKVRKYIPFIENDVFLGKYIQTVEQLIHTSHSQDICNKPVDFDFLADNS